MPPYSAAGCRPPSVRGSSKQITKRDIDGHLTAFRRKPAECTRDVEHESAALESEADGSAGISTSFGTDTAALPRTVDAKLHHLVIKARAKSPCHVRCVCAREYDVSRQNYSDDVAEFVGHLLLANVQDVERDRRRPIRTRRQDESKSISNSSNGLRVMDCQLSLVLLGD